MTEQSPTAAFTASSFLDGANADYVDQLAARHAPGLDEDISTMFDPAWQEYLALYSAVRPGARAAEDDNEDAE